MLRLLIMGEISGYGRLLTSVKFQVTGKENACPLAKWLDGKDELLTWNREFPTVAPKILVMGIFAVQLTVCVLADPRGTFPNCTGEVQFKGNATGDPMQ